LPEAGNAIQEAYREGFSGTVLDCGGFGSITCRALFGPVFISLRFVGGVLISRSSSASNFCLLTFIFEMIDDTSTQYALLVWQLLLLIFAPKMRHFHTIHN